MAADKWTAKQRRLMEILADPNEKHTQEDIAAELRVTRRTLWNWRHLEGFEEEVGKLVRDHMNLSIPRIHGALQRKAERGDVPAATLIFKLRGELIDRQQVEVHEPPKTVAFTSKVVGEEE